MFVATEMVLVAAPANDCERSLKSGGDSIQNQSPIKIDIKSTALSITKRLIISDCVHLNRSKHARSLAREGEFL